MARLPTRRTPRRALTASATRLSSRPGSDNAYLRRVSQPWQYRALAYYDLIGELRYASHFYARQLSRVEFYPIRFLPNGKTKRIDSGPPVDLLNRIKDPGGGRSQLQFNYGRLMFITGEGVLFGSRLGAPDERWRFLWKDEVRQEDDGTWVRLDYTKQPIPGETGVGYRLWYPHPRWSDLPDSPIQGVLSIAEELIALTAAVRATAVTRLTNGMMVIPLEAIPSPPEPLGDEDPENIPMLEDYIEHIDNQIEDPGSASARVPFLYTPPYEYADRVMWLKTHDPQTDYMEKDLRTEAINRMALGLDMPPEALLGMTEANHWTGRQVQQDVWRSHGMLKAEQFADDLAEGYLKPALQDEEYPDWENVGIGYDDSGVVISPDRTADADAAFDRGEISDVGYRVFKSIPEEYAPSEEEKQRWLAWKMRDPAILPEEDLHGQTPLAGPTAAPPVNGNAADGPAVPQAGRDGTRQESMRASAEIIGAAHMSLRRCREVAGARLRRAQQNCSECKEKTDGEPNSIVASVLGATQVERLGITNPMRLVMGGAAGFADFLSERGFDKTQTAALQQTLEVWAARTIFDREPSLPAGFVASVEKAMEVSDVLAS